MRAERGHVAGDVLVAEPYELWGKIGGGVRVVEPGRLYVRGAIYGDLRVENKGRCHILGSVMGDLFVEPGAKVIHSGMLGGSLHNNGGRVYVESTARIAGRISTTAGRTKVDARFYTTNPQHHA